MREEEVNPSKREDGGKQKEEMGEVLNTYKLNLELILLMKECRNVARIWM